MWKDFFYYSRSERRAIIFLLCLAVVLLGVIGGVKYFSSPEPLSSVTEDEEIKAFIEQLEERDSLYRDKVGFRTTRTVSQSVVLQPFDPNMADSMTLRSLGLPAFIIRNILRYRAKGGIFRTPESFARIYGLSEQEFTRLKPYIVIGKRYDEQEDPAEVMQNTDSASMKLEKYPEGTIVDLNKADTVSLKRIPGIGSGLAKMIVNYRTRLGGFYNVTQLQELSYIGVEQNKWFIIENPQLEPLQVNRDGLDKLRSHPYMDFYKARAILEYRRKRGKIKGLSQLSMMEEFTEKDLQRLTPYLSFE